MDGLFTLDEQRLVFPGITTPADGDRVAALSIAPMGYARRAPVNGAASRARVVPPGRHPAGKAGQQLRERLLAAADGLRDGLPRQRMLIARLRGLADGLDPPILADADVAAANTLVAAAERAIAALDVAITPVL